MSEPESTAPPWHGHVLLGPQRHQPTLPRVVAMLGLQGRVATITAGWQEREAEDADLQRALEGRGVNLHLHARSEAVYRDDPELFAAHRAKQDRLRDLQALYRLRLGPLIEAVKRLQSQREPAPAGEPRRQVAPELVTAELEHAITTVRALDEHHVARVAAIQTAYEDEVRPHERPVVRHHAEALRELLADCPAVAIAGGHVATLLNRIQLFGLGPLLADKALIAWSAGAMVLTRRIVLFHDRVPGKSTEAEVLAPGLDLCPGIVVLPDATYRLELDLRDRMQLLAARFRPELGVTLDDGDAVVRTDTDRWRALLGAPRWLRPAGTCGVLPGSARDDDDDAPDHAEEDPWRSPSIA